ncbi:MULTISPECIES: CU044_5270 family protein [Pseudofrankia]|uniref:CU044_5270 family protein n=1 Tax=Pseudofrankia TaxID=2994363 RepID=UPI000234B9E1|nr:MULTISPECIES: CU044_5270 family protein [Pseudofrankia]OHV38130.1 hypothetical protein BCD49_14265 [Pseudofrankia sp. EUN1h]
MHDWLPADGRMTGREGHERTDEGGRRLARPRNEPASDEVAARAELASLALLWDDVGEPGPDRLADARRRLLDRAALAGDGTAPAPSSHQEGRPARNAGKARRRPRVTARRAVAVAAAAVIVAGGLFAVDTLTVDGTAGATAEAASLLEQAAASSAATPDPPVGPSQYRKITNRGRDVFFVDEGPGKQLSWQGDEVNETWIPGDPAKPWVLRRTVPGGMEWRLDKNGVPRATPLPQPPTELVRAAGGAFHGPVTPSWQTPTPEFIAGLPRDPDQLLGRIYHDSAGQGKSKDGEALVFIADLLRGGFVPADLRAALFRAASGIPGVAVTDHAANLAGKDGVAVGRDEDPEVRQEIIFDPATGEYIGEREVVLVDDAKIRLPKGATLAYTAVTTEVVDSAP